MSAASSPVTVDPLGHRIDAWLRGQALPLWAEQGFDAKAGLFQESLGFDGAPNLGAPRRLMVQARQIAVYAAACQDGRFPEGADLALRAMRQTIAAYFEADGAPGWVFSLSPEGRPADGKRDLYAHAFILFALAWALRLEDDGLFRRTVDKTLDFLAEAFADPDHGGYWDCLPRADALRRQNPHMHLFEALIALQQTCARDDILHLCHKLHALALTRFFDSNTGALRELFDKDWSVHPAPGQGSVEPGHLFEWAWLLRQYQEVSAKPQDQPVKALITMATRHGVNLETGRIVDEIAEDGALRAGSSRCWPHCEALKALAEEITRGDAQWTGKMRKIGGRLLDRYCPSELHGGWIDWRDADDRPISKHMPASSLYHIYFGLDAAIHPDGSEAIAYPSGF
jgi:mannose-6-phosphate isomerase